MTGLVPQQVVESDFRNIYCIIGMITIDTTCWPPMLYAMGEESHDAAAVLTFVGNAVAAGWLRRGDFLVLDNARVHSGGSADILSEVLWNAPGIDNEPLNVILVPYPTRAPEINPIELCWNIYLERSCNIRNDFFSISGAHRAAIKHITSVVLSNISHDDVIKTYQHCGYFGTLTSNTTITTTNNN